MANNPNDKAPDARVELVQSAPVKLDPRANGYTGTFIERATNRRFARKVVEGAEKPFKLLSIDHGEGENSASALYHELNEEDFRRLFDKE